MTEKLRVGLIFGGKSGEHEISLASAQSVARAIDKEKHAVTLIGITKEDAGWQVLTFSPNLPQPARRRC